MKIINLAIHTGVDADVPLSEAAPPPSSSTSSEFFLINNSTERQVLVVYRIRTKFNNITVHMSVELHAWVQETR